MHGESWFQKMGMIYLFLKIVQSTWCRGIEEDIMGLDENLHIPLLQIYMEHPPGSLIIANIPSCQP